MKQYFILIAGMILIPLLYAGGILGYRSHFQKEENQKRKPLQTVPEWLAVVAAEVGFFGIWLTEGRESNFGILFWLLTVILVGVQIFCMTDYWERVVPNRILLILLWIFLCIIGIQGIHDMEQIIKLIPSFLLGVLFCLLLFGFGYLLSRGNIGAGDIKLALVMGLYLTGEYVVGAIFYGCLSASVFSVVQMLRKKLSRKDTIPFVPFLYVGLIIRYLMG